MDGPALSWQERRILAEIETVLAADTRLARELSTMHRGRLRWPDRLLRTVSRIPGSVLTVLAAASVVLLLIGAQLGTVRVLAPVGAVATVTLLLVVARPLRRLVARRRGE
ncbi:hypothetical protein OHV05_05500 [Kitasatospora sp. NBC_00070]|uniref:hypothetical protein n=1 Tax=Kitasatospora sp. NBC_00070 TaxID=2975962 RepID=UPI003255C5BF